MQFIWSEAKLLISTIDIRRLKSTTGFVAFLSIAISSLFSTSAFAEYKYVYTGNTFISTFNQNYIEWPDYFFTDTEMVEQYISVSFVSPTLLTSPIDLSIGLPFTISVVGSGERLGYPSTESYPPPFPPEWIGMGFNPSFNIYAVDAQGLPTDWAIAIGTSFHNPRGNYNDIRTSTNQDSSSGEHEGYSSHYGQLDNNPGSWTVTAVPEPEIYGMMLAGLAVTGFMIRRRYFQSKT